MCYYDRCYIISFALVILINLGCGICVSAVAAFGSDGGNPWAILIFGLYALFSGGLIYFTIKHVYFNEEEPSHLHWIAGMSAVITIGMILAVALLVNPANSIPTIVAMAIVAVNLIVFGCVTSCYVNFVRWGGGSGLEGQPLDCEKCLVFSGVTCFGLFCAGRSCWGMRSGVV